MSRKLQVEFFDGRVGKYSQCNAIYQEVHDRLPRVLDDLEGFLPRWAMAVERMGVGAVKRVRIEDGAWHSVCWPPSRSAAARARRVVDLCILELATRTSEQRRRDHDALVPDLDDLE